MAVFIIGILLISSISFFFKDYWIFLAGIAVLLLSQIDIIILAIGKLQASKKTMTNNELPQEADQNFHNDFSKVGSGDPNIQVKPIDYSGDAYANGRKAIFNDLQKLGLKKK